MASCPYEARFTMPEGYVSKCTFCSHRVDEGKNPACMTVCPAHAIEFGDLSNPMSRVSRLLRKRQHKVLKPEKGTAPQIYYLT